jgi:hypothetical protein
MTPQVSAWLKSNEERADWASICAQTRYEHVRIADARPWWQRLAAWAKNTFTGVY